MEAGGVTPHDVREGALTRDDIRQWMQMPVLAERLVITPLLNPAESFGPANFDVRLGNQFLVFKQESFAVLDVGATDRPDMTRHQQRIVKPLGRQFVLHPHQLVIGSTLEYVQIPPGLMCYVIGKSGWGRMGLVIATATKVDPGFRGCITLEIINEGEVPLILYPGLPIAQLVFHTTSSPSAYSGSYHCPIGPQFPKLTPANPLWGFWTRQLNKRSGDSGAQGAAPTPTTDTTT